MNEQLFRTLFEVGEIIASANPDNPRAKAKLKILAIEHDCVRYQSIDSQSRNKFLYSYLDVVVDGFERIDPNSIQATIQKVLLDAGLRQNVSTENYAYGFAREIRNRSIETFVSSGETLVFPIPTAPDVHLRETGKDLSDIEQRSFVEGAVLRVIVDRQERSLKARAACIRFHGSSCLACNFSFEAVYGTLGIGFIHVHHLNLISNQKDARPVTPETDLVPLCPNCHAMVHTSNPPLTIAELRDAISTAKRRHP